MFSIELIIELLHAILDALKNKVICLVMMNLSRLGQLIRLDIY